jgi:hypothetical protein
MLTPHVCNWKNIGTPIGFMRYTDKSLKDNKMQKRIRILMLFLAAAILKCADDTGKIPTTEESQIIDRLPIIEPDYSDIILPPNIAPTNFVIKEDGLAYAVEIASEHGDAIHILSTSSTIRIPPKQWKNLLDINREKSLRMTIFVQKKQGEWSSFSPIENYIANDSIDTHLVYRIIPPTYQSYDKMRIYQRDLQNYDERTIVYNKSMGNNCVNCHSFHNYNPDRMILHMRGGKVGTSMMMLYDGDILKIDTSTPFNKATSYRSWHPNGEIIAFAFNDVRQLFHSMGENRDVFDLASDLILYNVKTRTITTSAKICTEERMETYPEWSPDGKYIYFCSAPGLDYYDTSEHPYKQMRYDLMRIAYDVENNEWGDVEPILLASEHGQSVAHAKPSPDGKYILLCLSDYSYFPLYRPESDLYLLDTQTNDFWSVDELNSDFAESYHCWSSNGRWVVFSSKRRDGICTDPYFSYFDVNGKFSKPFLLPQNDPAYHKSLFRVYNIPEFVNGPINVRSQKLVQAAWNAEITKTELDPDITKRRESQPEDRMYKPFQ